MAKIIWESEKELEDYIYSKLENSYNPINGDDINWCARQVEIGPYGIIDLITIAFHPCEYHAGIDITIIEVKKEIITAKAFAQLARYMKGIRHYFESYENKVSYSVRGILVAPDIDKSDSSIYLINECEDISVYLSKMNLESGVEFEHQENWHVNDPDFIKFGTLFGNQMISDAENFYESFRASLKAWQKSDDDKDNGVI